MLDAHDCTERWNIYIFLLFLDRRRSEQLSGFKVQIPEFRCQKGCSVLCVFSLKSTLHWRYCRCIVVCVHSSGPHVHIQRLFIKLTAALLPCRVFFFSSGSSLFSFYGAVSVHSHSHWGFLTLGHWLMPHSTHRLPLLHIPFSRLLCAFSWCDLWESACLLNALIFHVQTTCPLLGSLLRVVF